jgi:hypothetical protein
MNNCWKQKKNYLWKLIKKLSDEYGGDDLDELKDYARDMIKKYADNLEVCIVCFEWQLEAKCGRNPLRNFGADLKPFMGSK